MQIFRTLPLGSRILLVVVSLFSTLDAVLSIIVFETLSGMNIPSLNDMGGVDNHAQLQNVLLIVLVMLSVKFLGENIQVFFSVWMESSLFQQAYKKFIRSPYIKQISKNESDWCNNLLFETNELVGQLFYPLVKLIGSFFFLSLVGINLIISNHFEHIAVVFCVGIYFLFSFLIAKTSLTRFGAKRKEQNDERFSLVNTTMQTKEIIKLSSIHSTFEEKIHSTSKQYTKYKFLTKLMGSIPSFILQFGTVASFYAISLAQVQPAPDNWIIGDFLALGFIAWRTLPMMQVLYSSFAAIKGGHALWASFRDTIEGEEKLHDVTPNDSVESLSADEVSGGCSLDGNLVLNEVQFNKFGFSFEPIDLKLRSGETYLIIGRNGVGKSTFVKLASGLLTSSSGEIYWETGSGGRALRSQRVGYLGQKFGLFSGTIGENLLVGMDTNDADDLLTLTREACVLFGIDEFLGEDYLNQKVGTGGRELSGGQVQRICLVRALIRGRDLLILDEAFSAIDEITRKSLLEKIRFLSPSAIILLVTHDREQSSKNSIELTRSGDVVCCQLR